MTDEKNDFDKIAESLNMKTDGIPENEGISKDLIDKETREAIEKLDNTSDDAYAASLWKLVAERGINILTVLEKELVTEPSARCAEVAAEILEQLVNVASAIKNGKIQDIKNKLLARQVELQGKKTDLRFPQFNQQNIFMSGAFKDIVKELRNAETEKENIIDVKPVNENKEIENKE